MKHVYLDSSAVLRYVFGQPGYIDLSTRTELAIASPLTGIECLRSLDRDRLAGSPEADRRARLDVLGAVVERLIEVELTRAILSRAAGPMPLPLGTLDAIHLVSALHWHEFNPQTELLFATHDRALARAARLCGLTVLGVESA